MRASIVIASYNERPLLERTIRSCLETTADLDCEILVADDSSTDGSVRGLERLFPSVRFVEHAQHRGVALTKDLAARCATGDILIFLDGHCKPEPGAIARLAADVERLNGRAIVTPRIAALDPSAWEVKRDQVGHGYYVDLDSFALGWIDIDDLRPYGPAAGEPLYAQPTCIGCCAAMGRDAYDRLWGFDTGMLTYGSEDVDLGVKAWLMGHPVLHDPEPIIGHRFRPGFDLYPVPQEHLVVNQLRMARKHFSDPTWFDWLGRTSARLPAEMWESAWRHYLDGYESLERERSYLMANRVHDEFWYAAAFAMAWPKPGAVLGPKTASPSPSPKPLIAPSAIPSPKPSSSPTFNPARSGMVTPLSIDPRPRSGTVISPLSIDPPTRSISPPTTRARFLSVRPRTS
jgi:GT2 family glycosyltransferase